MRVDVIAVGTGKALKLAENGDADVVLVHAPRLEKEFVRRGFGVDRRPVMYNDFLITGPGRDPAGARGRDATRALAQIAAARHPFISRGDMSGTYVKEMDLWKKAGITPSGDWYLETGQGMASSLFIAYEKQAYCLADRATYTICRDKIDLAILCEGDRALRNPYSIIATNPERHPHVNQAGARALTTWLTSPAGQAKIAVYRRDGEVLFHPVRPQ